MPPLKKPQQSQQSSSHGETGPVSSEIAEGGSWRVNDEVPGMFGLSVISNDDCLRYTWSKDGWRLLLRVPPRLCGAARGAQKSKIGRKGRKGKTGKDGKKERKVSGRKTKKKKNGERKRETEREKKTVGEEQAQPTEA